MDEQTPDKARVKFPWFVASAFFLCGMLSVIAYMFATSPQQPADTSVIPESPDITPQSERPVTLTPPAQALSGVLLLATDGVTVKKRSSGDFEPASKSAAVLIGESIATTADARAVVDIAGLGTVSLGQLSEVVFANLFINNSVILQKSGQVRYDVRSQYPVAVRSYSTLVSASSSAFLVSMDAGQTAVSVASGSAKAALVDLQNTTHVWDIPEGSRAIIDDATRTVRIR